MVFTIVAVSLLLVVSQARAQYSWAIPCRSDMQCASILTTSQGPQIYRCSQGFCLCPNITTGVYELCSNRDMILTAMKPTGLRRNCTTHEDCSMVEGANCMPKDKGDKSSKICLCQLDKVESEDGQSCLAAVSEIGGTCKEAKQCISRLGDGAECHSNRCRCSPTHHHKGDKCIRNLGHGDNCKMEEDGCYEVHSEGGDNLMICTEAYGCRCKKHWTYNQKSQHCQYSGASQIVIHVAVIAALLSMIAFF